MEANPTFLAVIGLQVLMVVLMLFALGFVRAVCREAAMDPQVRSVDAAVITRLIRVRVRIDRGNEVLSRTELPPVTTELLPRSAVSKKDEKTKA